MSKELPKTIYVMMKKRWPSERSFLAATENLEDMTFERDRYATVGKYVFDGAQKVTLKTVIKEGD